MAFTTNATVIGPDNSNGTTEQPVSKPVEPVTNISNGNPNEIIPGYESYDPGTDFNTGTGAGGDTARKRRGRPPGSRNNTGTGTIKTPKNLEGVESLLLSIHFMGATILQTPELALDPDEAKKLSNAIQNVAQFYPVGMSPKTLAWVNLAMVAGGIYSTRFIAIMNNSKKEKKSKPLVLVQPEPDKNKPNGAAQTGPLTPSQLFGSAAVDGEL